MPEGDEDAALLVEALAGQGALASWRVWTDADVDWRSYELVVVRTPWDYTARRAEFLSWTHRVPRLANPPDVLAWNSDKRYLGELAAAGVPIVPTTWSTPGAELALPDGPFVLKPSVGAGSKGAGRFDPTRPGVSDTARAHAAALHDAGRTVMVQPYLADVDEAGETALIYLAGRFSHAIGKSAMLAANLANELDPGFSASLFLEEHITVRLASAAELDLGDQVLRTVRAMVSHDLLYARVDLLPTPDGPVLIELELIEPSLFLSHGEQSAERFAAAIIDAATELTGR
ncbi:MAG: hypothetical protein ABJB98_02505 [Actinomycetota bacterium]